jgi:hypothetical protein
VKKTIREVAENIVDALLVDMDDRQGFDRGGLPGSVLDEWRETWIQKTVDILSKEES